MIKIGFTNRAALEREIRQAMQLGLIVGVTRATKRGAEHMRAGIKSRSGALVRGTKFDPDETVISRNHVSASVVVSATSQPGPATGTLHLPSGKTREIPLDPGGGHDYGSNYVEGTGVYGLRGQRIGPVKKRALRIQVSSPPSGESYITAGGKTFIVRMSTAGMKPNDIVTPAVEKLEAGEAANLILDGIAEAFQ